MDHPSSYIAGIDGYRGGWVVVLTSLTDGSAEVRRITHFRELLDVPETPIYIGVDMVIGLPRRAERGGRACDRAARQLLGWPRSSSVFSPPVRAALVAETYAKALTLNRDHSPDGLGFSIEAFNLMPKMREVDAVMTPERQDRIREVHPELSFYAMNGGRAIREGKRTKEGRAKRIAHLADAGFASITEALDTHTGGGLKADDVLDACAACWSARRMVTGDAVRLPEMPETDARGLRMEIWY